MPKKTKKNDYPTKDCTVPHGNVGVCTGCAYKKLPCGHSIDNVVGQITKHCKECEAEANKLDKNSDHTETITKPMTMKTKNKTMNINGTDIEIGHICYCNAIDWSRVAGKKARLDVLREMGLESDKKEIESLNKEILELSESYCMHCGKRLSI